MNHRLLLAACAALLAFTAGCDQRAKAPTPAETNANFEAYVKAVARKPAAELSPEELDQAVNQYVSMQVAAEAAEKAGLEKDKEVAEQLKLTRANVLSETLLRRYLDDNPITDQDIQAEYDAQVSGMPPEFKARHILVDDKALAEAIIEKLKAKGDFSALAKQYSKDSSAQNGGDLGWFSPQSMVKEFGDAVQAMEKGSFSQVPVQTQYGWHVIQLEDKRAAQLPDLAMVKDRVRQLVQRKRVNTHMDELKKASKLDPDKLTAALKDYAAKSKAEPPKADAASGAAEPASPAAPPSNGEPAPAN